MPCIVIVTELILWHVGHAISCIIPVTELVFLSAYSLCSDSRNPGIVERHVSSKWPIDPV
jgi:hypothetical protein